MCFLKYTVLKIRFLGHVSDIEVFCVCFQITVEPHDGQELEEEGQHEELSVCEECGRSDRRHLMLLCSACDLR